MKQGVGDTRELAAANAPCEVRFQQPLYCMQIDKDGCACIYKCDVLAVLLLWLHPTARGALAGRGAYNYS